jgi:hypothetical protein
MEKGFSQQCVSLEIACIRLSLRPQVQALLKSAVGNTQFTAALAMMKLGSLTGDLGATIHDLLLERIEAEAVQVWGGFIYRDGGRFPISVNEFNGVFWVLPIDGDPIGYFLDRDHAVEFVRVNWDDVHEDAETLEVDEEAEMHCPYCHATEDCDHLLLVVDRTFREAQGGRLMEAFNSRWSELVNEADDPDFDESEYFDELLEELDSLADMSICSSPNSAPGLTSSYSLYFCSSKLKAGAAVESFGV